MKIHIIQKGETMGTIAAQYDVDVQRLERSNQQLINPSTFVPGMKLMVPQQSKNIQYKNQNKHAVKENASSPKTIKKMHPRRPIGKEMTDDSDREEHPLSSDKNLTDRRDGNSKRRKQIHPHIYCDCCHRKMHFTS